MNWREALALPQVRALAAHVRQHVPSGVSRLLIGFSGGRDSSALALAAAAAAKELDVELMLVHVNHHLHVDCGRWAAHCQAVAAHAGIALHVCEVEVTPAGRGLEAAARAVRYAAIEALLHEGDALLTAHHQRDQAETVLLRLLRGTGVDGLAAMAHQRRFGPGWLCRPLLDAPAQSLADAVAAAGLAHIEDPSNVDTHLDRVFLRERVLPLLRSRWSAADQVLARAARLGREAAEVVNMAAEQLLAEVSGEQPGALSRSALAKLPRARAKAVLRTWLRRQRNIVLDAARIDDLLHLLTENASPGVSFVDGRLTVRCYRDQAFVTIVDTPRDDTLPRPWRPGEPLRLAHGQLKSMQVRGAGLSARHLADRSVTVRYRQHGERVEFGRAHQHRALKKQFQHWGVPPWERDRLPLVCIDDEVVCVPGYMTAASLRAGPGETGWQVTWEAVADDEY